MKNSRWRLNFLRCERSLEEISPALQANKKMEILFNWQPLGEGGEHGERAKRGSCSFLFLIKKGKEGQQKFSLQKCGAWDLYVALKLKKSVVFDAILTGRQSGQKLPCLYGKLSDSK